jgi:ABC-type Fe3+-hydroxamate transport system substrate-binding protein
MEVDDIGYNDTISVEKIISLQPDVVLMSASVNYSYMEDKLPLLDAANIPVVFFDYHVDTKESIRKSNEILGKVLHQEERAKEISDFYDAKVDAVFDAVKDIKEEDRPNVYMEFSKGKDEYGNTWSKKMWGSLIGQCGGKNVAYDVSDANSVDLAKEAIIANNPDVIIFTGALQNGLTGNIVLGYNQDEEKAKEYNAAPEQLSLFVDYDQQKKREEKLNKELEKEKRVQEALLSIKKKYGKNSVLKATDYEEGATGIDRNNQIGGHKA